MSAVAERIDIEDVRRLNVKPGEVLLVTIKGRADMALEAAIREAFKAYLPGVKVLIHDADTEISILSPGEVTE